MVFLKGFVKIIPSVCITLSLFCSCGIDESYNSTGENPITEVPQTTAVENSITEVSQITAVENVDITSQAITEELVTETELKVISTAKIHTDADYVEIKTSAEDSSNAVARAVNGDNVDIYSIENEWCYCLCNGFAGYIRMKNITFNDSENNQKPIELPVQTVIVTQKDIRVNEDTNDVDYYVNDWVYVNVSDALAMRTGPSTDYEKIADLYNGDSLYVYYALTNSRGYRWYYASYGDKVGYVIAKYTTFECPVYDLDYDFGYDYADDYSLGWVSTNGDNLFLRDAPSGNVITKIPNGSCVEIHSVEGDWLYIYYDGNWGYASAQYITY